ncbi:ribbon-helix-helix domain-containing protein [Leptolyngbya sp. NIES-2104]|uniref:ribbon-helix-helix domain-containing protein n=1 Tax=Leptolyngbya sp. NIES-2104 TaxID=1552121 RepID=UPI0006ECB4E0|nr:hypothetical protein [Leptolyngbya sp. NIES-2104]GAP97422.1 hypothetical protein NIES2104_39690 [Leptolyngbya sp. NIES-2104]
MEIPLNISLPESLREFIEARVQEDNYSTPSEYVRTLIQEDQKRRETQKLEAMVQESLASGDSIEVTPEYWENKRQNLLQRFSNGAS